VAGQAASSILSPRFHDEGELCMISPETRVQIRRYFYAEHWKIGTIATALDVHPDTVRRAIEVERFQHAEPLRPSIVDPYLPFVREVLEQHPRLRATRIHQMIRDRGYSGISVPTRHPARWIRTGLSCGSAGSKASTMRANCWMRSAAAGTRAAIRS